MGANYFIIEFKEQGELFHVLRGGWHIRGEMVICRMAKGPADTVEPQVNEVALWVEVHGVPPETVTHEGVQLVFKRTGTPLNDIKVGFYGTQKIYKQQVLVKVNEPLVPRVPVNLKTKKPFWAFIVYTGVINVCLHCAYIGHDHVNCPTRMRLWRLKHEGRYTKDIPDKKIGRWITDRTRVPRDDGPSGINSIASGSMNDAAESSHTSKNDSAEPSERNVRKRQKSVMLLNEGTELTRALEITQPDNTILQINCKLAREANPNSPSRSQ